MYAERTEKTAPEKDKTGIPRKMKSGFERSSGFSFNDVRVHYNSEKPAQLHAHAYTRGNEVYVAPGQERHLPHELGHIVQQKSDMVKPTGKIGGLPLNDDEAMESGADRIAEKAQTEVPSETSPVQGKFENGSVVQRDAAGLNSLVSGLSTLLRLGDDIFGFFHSSREKHVTQIENSADEAEDTCREAEVLCDEMIKEDDQQAKIKKAINTKKCALKAKDLSQRAKDKCESKSSMKKNTYIIKTKERAEAAKVRATKCLTKANMVLYPNKKEDPGKEEKTRTETPVSTPNPSITPTPQTDTADTASENIAVNQDSGTITSEQTAEEDSHTETTEQTETEK